MRALLLPMLLLSAAAAHAQATPSATGSVRAAEPAKSKLICKTRPVTGTRLGSKRECATAEEWDRLTREQRQNLEKSQTNQGRIDG